MITVTNPLKEALLEADRSFVKAETLASDQPRLSVNIRGFFDCGTRRAVNVEVDADGNRCVRIYSDIGARELTGWPTAEIINSCATLSDVLPTVLVRGEVPHTLPAHPEELPFSIAALKKTVDDHFSKLAAPTQD